MLIQGFKCHCSPVLFSEGETWIHAGMLDRFILNIAGCLGTASEGDGYIHPRSMALSRVLTYTGASHILLSHILLSVFLGESTEVSRFFSFFTKPREIVRSVTSIVLLHLCLIYLKF